MKKGLVILIAVLFFLPPQSEVKALETPLKSFIQLALENNLGLRQQELILFRKKIELKKLKKEEFYPEINLFLQTSRGKETKWVTEDDLKKKDVITRKERPALKIDTSISRSHPFGGKLKLDLDYEIKKRGKPEFGFSLESEEPLSRYKRDQFKKPFMDEEMQLEKERWQLEKKINETIYQVITSYIETQKINLSIHLKERELKDLKETQEVANLKFEKGIIPEIDLLQIRLQIFNIEIEIDTLKNQLDKEISKFYYLCFGKINQFQDTKIFELSEDYYQKKIASLKEKIAMMNLSMDTPEINIKQIEIKEAKRKIEETKALNTPSIIPFFNFNENEIRSEKIGLRIKFPIYHKGIKEEEITLAGTTLTEVETELKDLTFETQMNITTTLNNIQEKERRIEALETNIKVAKQIYEISRIKHERGLISARDLLDDHKQVFHQQNELLQLHLDLYLEYIALLNLMSQLNDAYQEDIL